MYIFECIWKLFRKKEVEPEEFNYDPLNQPLIDDYERCNHEFMPVDSTRETLACIKCGFIVKRNNMNEVNYGSDS